jgi:urease accessory protein
MDVIEQIARPEAGGTRAVVDRVALTWEQRQKSRQKLRTVGGREIALALPTGTRLHAGDLLATAEGWIEVQLAAEDLLLIRPRDPKETAFVAYQIGNRHLPLGLAEQTLQTPYERVLAAYLSQQGIPVERIQLPFTPVSALGTHRHA